MSKNNLKNRYISFFTPKFILGLLSLLALFGLFFWQIAYVSVEKEAQYQDLMKASESSNPSVAKAPYKASQKRFNVQKDLYFLKDLNRLQIRLKAKKSIISLEPKDFHTRIIEHMSQVVCFMQEELFYQLPDGNLVSILENGELKLQNSHLKSLEKENTVSFDKEKLKPMQIIKIIYADLAEYDYKGDAFTANQVKISRYIDSGHQIHELSNEAKLLMDGVASKVEFAIDNKTKDFQFKAYKLKAQVFDLPATGKR